MSEELQRLLGAAVSAQFDHPVYPRLELRLVEGGRVEVKAGEMVRVASPAEAMQMVELRQKTIRLEAEDPFRHGYEPAFWSVVDWAVARKRCEAGNESAVLEVLIQGGNRAAKTEYAAKRFMEALALNAGWLCWGLHSDQAASRSVQQRRIWHYMPREFKPETGKLRKTVKQRLNYNQESGFTENMFSLPNGSAAHFKFYSADVKALEGDEPDVVWSDEEIPEDWVEALGIRLITKAGKTRELVAALREELAKLEADPGHVMPKGLRGQLWRGVHLITFTPISGQTPTVRRFTKGARPIRTEPAELLPIDAGGKVLGYEHVPRVLQCAQANRIAVYFHTRDNAHGGNYPGMVAQMRGKTRREIKIRVYGVTEATRDARFPKFSRNVHVVPAARVPKDATWYHVVDPCPGRNWFMLWAAVNALGEVFVAREWPDVNDYVPGVGRMGEWAGYSSGKRKDGDRGPAQASLGWGHERYAEEIERVEVVLGERVVGEGKRLPVFERIIDSRAGNTPSLAKSETLTLIEAMADLGLDFMPSGMRVAPEGTSRARPIDEGVGFINGWLDWREDLAKEGADGRMECAEGAAPRLFISEECENLIWALENWTGEDGQDGACKDPVDVLRYLRIHDPVYAEGEAMLTTGGGCY